MRCRLPGQQFPAQTASSPVKLRLGTGGESRDLLVPHMHQYDLALATDRIGQPVQAVAEDAIYPLHTGRGEGLCKLVSNSLNSEIHADKRSRLRTRARER